MFLLLHCTIDFAIVCFVSSTSSSLVDSTRTSRPGFFFGRSADCYQATRHGKPCSASSLVNRRTEGNSLCAASMRSKQRVRVQQSSHCSMARAGEFVVGQRLEIPIRPESRARSPGESRVLTQRPSGTTIEGFSAAAVLPWVFPEPAPAVSGRSARAPLSTETLMKTFSAKPQEVQRDWFRRRCHRQGARAPGRRDCASPARQAQARVHAARRHGRFHRRRQRRAHQGHRQQGRRQDLLPPYRLPGRHSRAELCEDAGTAPGPRAREGREGHAAEGPARLRDDQEAQGIRDGTHPHTAQQPKALEV